MVWDARRRGKRETDVIAFPFVSLKRSALSILEKVTESKLREHFYAKIYDNTYYLHKKLTGTFPHNHRTPHLSLSHSSKNSSVQVVTKA